MKSPHGTSVIIRTPGSPVTNLIGQRLLHHLLPFGSVRRVTEHHHLTLVTSERRNLHAHQETGVPLNRLEVLGQFLTNLVECCTFVQFIRGPLERLSQLAELALNGGVVNAYRS